ncbi:MAG TPA: SpoIIE family protein phosphatase, partial [Thermoanaerobaculia bacterium]|nr:SpoIIE family protein phosphatase [Thermoanaerobaculia bacterium]
EFAALHFAAPERNLYRYRLEGFSEQWIDARGDRRAATFTRLAPGAYVFHVQAANPDGAWNEEGARLAIRVLPPVWGTWWFRALGLLAAAAVTAFAWRRHARGIALEAELRAAHDAQMGIMPAADPHLPGFEISGLCVPAHEVGGDFFDYVWAGAEPAPLCIVVGDVAGKGMRSAMAAAMASGMAHAELRGAGSLAEAMTRINRAVHRKMERPLFAALCLARLDPSRRLLELVNAGVCPPLLVRDGVATEIASEGPSLPLGGLPGTTYRSREVALRSGDLLLLYTDGAPEATDRSGAQYGYEPLRDFAAALPAAGRSARELVGALAAELARFARGSRRQDDTTLVVVKIC